jgi:hypothetical protein
MGTGNLDVADGWTYGYPDSPLAIPKCPPECKVGDSARATGAFKASAEKLHRTNYDSTLCLYNPAALH